MFDGSGPEIPQTGRTSAGLSRIWEASMEHSSTGKKLNRQEKFFCRCFFVMHCYSKFFLRE